MWWPPRLQEARAHGSALPLKSDEKNEFADSEFSGKVLSIKIIEEFKEAFVNIGFGKRFRYCCLEIHAPNGNDNGAPSFFGGGIGI